MEREAKVATAPLRVVVSAPVHMLGGQATAARQIREGFQRDPEVTVELVAIDPRLSGPWRALTEWPLIRSIVRPLLYTARLSGAARKADLIHAFCAAHTAFFFGAVPALLVGGALGLPVILNYHDGRAEDHFRRWGRVLRWALSRADLLVVPSGYLQEVFGRRGYTSMVVPNVVRTDRIDYAPEASIRPRLISNRLLEPLYRVDNTIRAFGLVRQRYPDATLDIYGSGRSEDKLRALVAELELSGVTFHGRVGAQEMAAALEGGGILVNSSEVDNMPHVIIEAFAAGRPVVTTPAGGIPYMVEHDVNALVVPPGDPAAMAEAVGRLLEDPGLAHHLRKNGRDECRRYSWDVAGPGWKRVYDLFRSEVDRIPEA